jgi:hypothetical protein
MSAVRRIELRVITGDRPDAGTDGTVFLGLGGREFRVDSSDTSVNDFERASDRTYIFGIGANVSRPTENDPRSPWQIDSQDIGRCPRYIRLESGDGGDWNVAQVDVLISLADGGSATLQRLGGSAHLWLGWKRGRYLYFP